MLLEAWLPLSGDAVLEKSAKSNCCQFLSSLEFSDFVCVWKKMTESLNSVLKMELFDVNTVLFFFFLFFARYLFPKTAKSA